MSKPISTLMMLALGLSLVACSNADLASKIPDNRPNYKTSRTTNPLEIPPDLTSSSIDDTLAVPELSGIDKADLSTYQRERSAKNQMTLEQSLQQIHRSGDATWIEIADKPGRVFNHAKNFWINNGLSLSRVDANIGIMETDWLEARSNLPSTGLTALVKSLVSTLEDSGLRDKFRTRIDYDGKKTYVYLTHYGATEEQVDVTGKKTKSRQGNKNVEHFAWLASARNPELEVEMLRRLNLYLHHRGHKAAKKDSKQASNIAFAELSNGTPALVMDGNFNQAWVMLGIAIDRAGYDILGQNRRNGTYQFAKVTEKEVGLFLKEIERSEESYSLGIADQGKRQIAVLRSHNNAAPTPAEAKAVLQHISKEVRF